MTWKDSVSRLTVIKRALEWATGIGVILAALSGIVDMLAAAALGVTAGLIGLAAYLTGRRIERLEAKLTRRQLATLRGYLAAVGPGEVEIAVSWPDGAAAVAGEQLASLFGDLDWTVITAVASEPVPDVGFRVRARVRSEDTSESPVSIAVVALMEAGLELEDGRVRVAIADNEEPKLWITVGRHPV